MDPPENQASDTSSPDVVSPPVSIPYSSDITHRWEKIHDDVRQISVTGVRGTTVEAVYENTKAAPKSPPITPCQPWVFRA